MTRTTRRERALLVRDAVLIWLRQHGRDEVVSGYRIREGEIGGFLFTHRTPFSRVPLGPAPGTYAAALWEQRGGPVNLPYGLDLWAPDGKKAMLAQWTADGTFEVVTFRSGDLDARLLEVIRC